MIIEKDKCIDKLKEFSFPHFDEPEISAATAAFPAVKLPIVVEARVEDPEIPRFVPLMVVTNKVVLVEFVRVALVAVKFVAASGRNHNELFFRIPTHESHRGGMTARGQFRDPDFFAAFRESRGTARWPRKCVANQLANPRSAN